MMMMMMKMMLALLYFYYSIIIFLSLPLPRLSNYAFLDVYIFIIFVQIEMTHRRSILRSFLSACARTKAHT